MEFKDYIKEETLLQALDILGWHTPTAIQEQLFQLFSQYHAIMIQAQTGSGKTGAYALPILDRIQWAENKVQCLILAPTRELANQIREECERLGKYKRIKSVALIGKQPMAFQMQDLHQKCHVAVGTPGRVLEHLHQGSLCVERLSYVVLDEADEMLQMRFRDTLEQILTCLPKQAQYCLCSATMSKEIEEWCHTYFPDLVKIKEQDAMTPSALTFEAYVIEEEEKDAFLWKLLIKKACASAIIFCNTRAMCEHVYRVCQQHTDAVGRYHGAMDQKEREAAWAAFRYGEVQLLVASDIAARGLDMEGIETIIHYELPQEKERFLHRSGRSGRNQRQGHVISLLTVNEQHWRKELECYAGIHMHMGDGDEIRKQAIDEAGVAHFLAQRMQKVHRGEEMGKDILRLYIYGGKKKKIRAGDLVGAITQLEGIDSDDIGVIQVQDYGSYVEILHGKGSYVLECLQTMTIKNRHFKAEIAHQQQIKR